MILLMRNCLKIKMVRILTQEIDCDLSKLYKQRLLIIIKPYVDLVSNTLVISFFQPVFNRDNEIVGILSGDLPLEIFTKNIPEFKFSPSARVLIFENLFYVTPDRFMLDKKGKPFINALKEGM